MSSLRAVRCLTALSPREALHIKPLLQKKHKNSGKRTIAAKRVVVVRLTIDLGNVFWFAGAVGVRVWLPTEPLP